MSLPLDEVFQSKGGLASRITQPNGSPLTRAVYMQGEVSRELVELRTEMGTLAQGLAQVSNILDEMRQQQTVARLTAPLGQTREVTIRVERVGSMLGELERALHGAYETMQVLRNERGQLRALYVIAEHLNSTLELKDLLERVLDDLLLLLNGDRATIFLINDQGLIQFAAARDANQHSLRRTDAMWSIGALEQVWRTQQPLLTLDAQHDQTLVNSHSIQMQGIHAIMCAPLKVQGIAIGAVYIDQVDTHQPFTDDHKELLAAFCNEAAIAIQNALRFQDQIRQKQELAAINSYTDNILTSIESGVLAMNNEGTITKANQAVEAILHLPTSAILGQPYEEILGRLCDERVIADIREKMHEDEAHGNLVVQALLMGQSRESTIKVNWSALHNAERKRLGTVVVLDDLTKLAHAQHDAKIFRRYVHPDVVDAVTQHPAGAEIGGQTREITILFADIRNYTHLSEQLDPATLVDLLNRYLKIATEAILAHGGTVTMFQGDAVMAIFNAPSAQPDHAWRAVQAAWDVLCGIKQVAGKQAVECGIGVHTGVALVGNIGAAGVLQNYTAIGDAVNVAKRLEQSAPGNQILLGDETFQRVAALVHANREPDMLLKGKTQPIPVWSLRQLR